MIAEFLMMFAMVLFPQLVHGAGALVLLTDAGPAGHGVRLAFRAQSDRLNPSIRGV